MLSIRPLGFRSKTFCSPLHFWSSRFHSFLLFLGYSRAMVRDTKAEDFCKTISNFSLEYRTMRQAILLQREREERQKSGAESPSPNTPVGRRKRQQTPTQVLYFRMLSKWSPILDLTSFVNPLSVDPPGKWGAGSTGGSAENTWVQLKTGRHFASKPQEDGWHPRYFIYFIFLYLSNVSSWTHISLLPRSILTENEVVTLLIYSPDPFDHLGVRTWNCL